MASSIPVIPTLSSQKLVKDPNMKLQLAYLYFFASDYSQSTTYYGNISSAKKILEEYQDDIDLAADALASSLTNMLKRYFTTVDVATTVKNKDIAFDIRCTDQNGYIVTLSDSLTTDGGYIDIYKQLVDKYVYKIY